MVRTAFTRLTRSRDPHQHGIDPRAPLQLRLRRAQYFVCCVRFVVSSSDFALKCYNGHPAFPKQVSERYNGHPAFLKQLSERFDGAPRFLKQVSERYNGHPTFLRACLKNES